MNQIIDNLVALIRGSKYGRDVRSSIADGVEYLGNTVDEAVTNYRGAQAAADEANSLAGPAAEAANTAATSANLAAETAQNIVDQASDVIPIDPTVKTYIDDIMGDFDSNTVLYPPATSVTIGNYLSQSGGNISFTVIVPSGYYTDQGMGTFDCSKKGSMAITAAGKSTGNISSNGVKTLS